jgi:hypothetical protein
LPLLADLKQKEKQQTLSFFVCSFVVPNRMKKKRFPSSSLETNKQQQASSSCVCSSFNFAQNEKKNKNLDIRRIFFTLGQLGWASWQKGGILLKVLRKLVLVFLLTFSFSAKHFKSASKGKRFLFFHFGQN